MWTQKTNEWKTTLCPSLFKLCLSLWLGLLFVLFKTEDALSEIYMFIKILCVFIKSLNELYVMNDRGFLEKKVIVLAFEIFRSTVTCWGHILKSLGKLVLLTNEFIFDTLTIVINVFTVLDGYWLVSIQFKYS